MLKDKSVFYEELKQVGLHDLQESMSRALGLAAMVAYPDGRPLTQPSNLCSFCALLDSSPEARARCAASRVASVRAAAVSGEEVLHTCHAGLVHVAVPLQVAGETVAVVIGGNVALRPLAREAVTRLARETGIDLKRLLEAAGAVPLWTEERLRTVTAVVRKVTETVAQLLHAKEELGRKADQLAALFEFSRTVSGSLDVTEVAQRALGVVLELTGATSGSVVMLSDTPGVAASEVAATAESSEEFRVVPSGEVVAAVERETRAVHFNSRPGGRTLEERRPAVAIPLTFGGRVRGVLTAAGRPEGAEFAEDETAFLTTLGTSLVLALENARLFRELKLRAAMLERLIEVGRVVSSSLDVDVVVESALASVRDVLGAERCILRLLDEETGELVLTGSLGMGAELQARAGRVRPEGTVLGKVLETGEPVVVEDLAGSESGLHLPYYSAEIRALAVVPVRAGGKVLGTLKIYSSVPRRWTEEEVGYLGIVASQTGLALQNARLYSSLREYYLSAVQALAAALEAKDVYTRGHSVRVARWAQACARVLGLGAEEQEQVYLAGLLHDLGKIGVREDILLKPGRLDEEERKEMQLHPVVGARILEPARFPTAVIEAVRHHHEDYGGGGYPAGLIGEEIPLLARIIRVADAYDAMTSARPYREALRVEQAREELRRCAGRQFDPRVVEAFLGIPLEEMENISAPGGGEYPHSFAGRDTVLTEAEAWSRR
ncbi:MAG TPA: GAF domain-containing protein [Firmicutes bacterium]|nr:GAF domain-containing protein [Bacillota bacterium]